MERGATRREMLFRTANGFGGLALAALLAGCRREAAPQGAPAGASPIKLRPAAAPGRAKSAIFLFMEGGPSQVDTFDPKPRLAAENGQPMKLDLPARLQRERILQSPFKFNRCGESGIDVSELFPHVAQCVDRLAVIRSMTSEHNDHGTANYFLATGAPQRGRPSMGSWFSYGLGDESENLPAYVVMNDGTQLVGGADVLGNGFLPARYGPTLLRSGEEPLYNLKPREPRPELQQRKVEAIRRLNELAASEQGGDDRLESIIQNYYLAFRMQTAVVEAVDTSRESEATRKLYGLDDPKTEPFGSKCLRARRLVERGVRFVQIVSPETSVGANGRWDQHAELVEGHRLNALLVDKPIAGLLKDLEKCGLLDQTLVLWGGEFGRTPTAQTSIPNMKPGRDHNRYGFTIWMAGGGVKGGVVYGRTDDYGFHAVENVVTVHDLHATILHLFGIDHTRLTYRHGGRDFRLTDVYGEVVADLLS